MLDVLRLDDPAYPIDRPLDLPAELTDAARIVLKRPAYVDSSGNLWLTHPLGRSVLESLATPVADHTAVVRETVRYVAQPDDGGPASAAVMLPGDGRTLLFYPDPTGRDAPDAFPPGLPESYRKRPVRVGNTTVVYDVRLLPFDVDFSRAQRVVNAVVAPSGTDAVVAFTPDLATFVRFDLPRAKGKRPANPVALAADADGVWAWSPWENGRDGGGAMRVSRDGARFAATAADSSAGWPDRLIEIVPLADGSVLTVYNGDDGPALKLIQRNEKPPSAELLRTVTPLAKQLADPDPAQRAAAMRAIEAQGPAAFPVLEVLREQLPAEARVRIESLLGERLSPTLDGLRPLEGGVRTLARFPGGGCTLRLDGGGTVDDDGDTPTRTLIPATVLIRPGRFVERVEPDAAGDFVPGRNSIQWVGDELLIGDPKLGPRRWVGSTLEPLLPPALAGFDTVVAIDARRRWLLTGATRPGETLLVDPTLPDPTPRLPIWTVVATGGVGRTEAGWPVLRRGGRTFVLEENAWRADPAVRPATATPELPAIFDRAGRMIVADEAGFTVTDAAGRRARVDVDAAGGPLLAATPGRVWAYTAGGKVRRYALADGPVVRLEATFTQGVPPAATAVWVDPAGRLILATPAGMAVGFTSGRVPAALGELMLRVER